MEKIYDSKKNYYAENLNIIKTKLERKKEKNDYVDININRSAELNNLFDHTYDQFADKYALRWYNEIVNTFLAGKSQHKLKNKTMLKNCFRHKLKK